MITHIQRYSFILVNIPIFPFVFSNPISLFKRHSAAPYGPYRFSYGPYRIPNAFLGTIQFFSSTKSQNNLSYVVLSIKHGVISNFTNSSKTQPKIFKLVSNSRNHTNLSTKHINQTQTSKETNYMQTTITPQA
jgi:hypothetical protein